VDGAAEPDQVGGAFGDALDLRARRLRVGRDVDADDAVGAAVGGEADDHPGLRAARARGGEDEIEAEAEVSRSCRRSSSAKPAWPRPPSGWSKAPAVRAAVAGSAAPAERLLSAALAFFDYYRDNPGDLDLGFYLFRGMKPLGLTRELNADLNARLQAALGEVERALGDLALPPEAAERETAALFGHAVGLPLLVHTGGKRLFRLDGRELMADYVDRPAARLAAPQAAERPRRRS
jgi:hypothetical protein